MLKPAVKFAEEVVSGELTEEELRQIISNYLDEVSRYYQERQRISLEGGRVDLDWLEHMANELLQAMRASVEPKERRRAVLQVLCRANQYREPGLSN